MFSLTDNMLLTYKQNALSNKSNRLTNRQWEHLEQIYLNSYMAL